MTQFDDRRPLILLVDDQPANLQVQAATLKGRYRIKTATNGADALLLAARADQPQLILLDLMMPEMSGVEVLGRLRSDAATQEIPVIVVTADADESRQLEALALGADDFLTKPVSPAVLQARVSSLIRRKQAEARFRQVVDLSPAAILIVDDTGRIRFANTTVKPMFGYAAGELIGQPFDRLVPAPMRAHHAALAVAYMAAPRPGSMASGRALQAQRLDGSLFPCEITLNPVPTEHGQGVLVSVFDMSERQRIEAQLRESNVALESRVAERTAELQTRNRELVDAIANLSAAQQQIAQAEKLASLGKLVASFAHDIGNPIGNVTTLSTLLASNLRSLQGKAQDGSLKRSDLLDTLARSEEATALVAHNLERVRELLASFKQIALDQATSERREIDLREWLERFVYTLSPSLAAGRHRIEIDAPAGLRQRTAPGPLGQVIANLVSNAVTHGFEGRTGGCVKISASRRADQALLLSVADNGAGIAAELLQQVFEPFFTTRAGSGGTGLGLDIVRNIVETTLHGEISVSSEPGAGSCFVIVLPDGAAPD